MTNSVKVVPMDQVEPISLPRGSWSRMVLTGATAPGIKSSLGYSIFTPGTVTASVSHEVEEVAFVLEGNGELRLDTGAVPFKTGQALFVPPHTWHAVANTGEQDVVMVFMFPYPDYPPTERR
jgi:mannose-6-phosphate isomerase-like protein (cupin superfamily)